MIGQAVVCCGRSLADRLAEALGAYAMIGFPIQGLLDEQACYQYLLELLHPQGLRCPRGHGLPAGQAPHDRHRAPLLDYRCQTCGAVFNLFTGSVWSGTRYRCTTIVLILRGIAQGVPTAHLARELGIDRGHLLHRRHAMQQLLQQHFPPDAADRCRDRSR